MSTGTSEAQKKQVFVGITACSIVIIIIATDKFIDDGSLVRSCFLLIQTNISCLRQALHGKLCYLGMAMPPRRIAWYDLDH